RFGGPQDVRISTADGAEWLTHLAPISGSFGEGIYLALAIPVDDILGPLARSARQTLLVSILVVLAFFPLVYFAAGAVSAPLRRLTGEIEGLKNLDVGPMPPVSSMIAEIQDLGVALASAKSMLGAFGKYVPKNLVRQII